MRSFIERVSHIQELLKQFPCVAVIGPRQCGKSTLAKHILNLVQPSLYLDLEKPSDRNKLTQNPELFLKEHRDTLICLDEIQRVPELFSILRSEIDERNKPGQFLILGSASPTLLRQSAESLAGRIAYEELTPFTLNEVGESTLFDLWVKGGYPLSFLTETTAHSMLWRKNYIKTFLEQDIPQLGFQIPSRQLERFWMMLAHVHGQVLNSSKLGSSMGLTHKTIRHYVDILEQTFVVRVLLPFESNLKKRLVKSPKVYIRDTGLLHALLDIESKTALFGHPQLGFSWEGFVIEQVTRCFSDYRASFICTEKETEIDLILEKGIHRFGVECKVSSDPHVSVATKRLIEEIGLDHLWVIAPIEGKYPLDEKITAVSIGEFLKIHGK